MLTTEASGIVLMSWLIILNKFDISSVFLAEFEHGNVG